MKDRVAKMACCWSPHEQSDQSADFILDVEKILNDYVWNKFKTSRPSWQKVCLRRKDYVVDVPMNYFHFDKLREEVHPRQRPSGSALTTASSQRPPTLTQTLTHVGREVSQNPMLASSHVMALSTDFANSTGNEQTYSFRFEKTRKAALSVTFQKGFTLGGKVNFTLGLPKVMADGKVTGETDMRLTVSKATGEVVEETLTWSASSEIKVEGNSSYTAKVLLSELPVSYTFVVWTKMSMPSGGAPATVTRKKGDDDFTYTFLIENLKLVFDGYKQRVEFLPEPLGEDTVTHSVVFKTTGIVDGVRLSDQKILLDGKKLDWRSSQGPPSHQGPFGHNQLHHHNNAVGEAGMGTSETSPQDGHLGTAAAATAAAAAAPPPPTRQAGGRMLALGVASPPPPPFSSSLPPPPIIEEVVEEEEDGSGDHHHHHHQHQQQQQHHGPSSPPYSSFPQAARGPGGGHPQYHQGVVPRIITTNAANATNATASPSSLASSPLSDAGSPDVSEGSKKSQTVTTV